MANRHNAFKRGGKAKPKVEVDYGNPTVIKEAKKKNKGGKVEAKATGGAAAPRLDKRARGGGVASGKDMTKSPFSSAHVSTSGDA